MATFQRMYFRHIKYTKRSQALLETLRRNPRYWRIFKPSRSSGYLTLRDGWIINADTATRSQVSYRRHQRCAMHSTMEAPWRLSSRPVAEVRLTCEHHLTTITTFIHVLIPQGTCTWMFYVGLLSRRGTGILEQHRLPSTY